tara:strand:+ start:74291 stop:74728 length:438 start_codon:yes stop_codon:yes gene_type:complete
MSFRIERIVEFADTDMAGIVHFSNYFKWMESAEHAFFRSLALPIIEKEEAFIKGWPRGRVSCQYKKPLRFQDTVIIELSVAEVLSQAIRYVFSFYKLDEASEEVLVARGEMTTVCAAFDREDGSLQACAITEAVREQIKVELSVG